MSTTNILDLNNRIDELEKNSGGGGSADSAKRSDIATEFSTETSYTAGNFVYHEGKLYQFNADHSAGAWDPTDVVEANVTDQIVSNASAIAGLTASDVAYDNTVSGLTATEAQGAIDEVAGGLSDVKDRIDANTLGTPVPLTYEVNYTAPSDGYIVGVASSGSGNYVTLNIGGVNMARSYSGGTTLGGYACAFVKKGMVVFFSGSGASNATANFYPLA